MEILENILCNSRELGKGYALDKFQEEPTYTIGGDLLKDGYRCPHCKKHNINKGAEVIKRYGTPNNIEFMFNHTGYSWTEDCRCALCGGLYSQKNGC